MGGSRANATLVRLYRHARNRHHDPVAAWAELTGNSELRRAYQRARGDDDPIPFGEEEAAELAAAAHVHAVKTYGPDRVACLCPPGSSISRFVALIGGAVLTDQQAAAEQVFGPGHEPPDPEDWARAAYVLLWGENGGAARSSGAHYLIAGRYKGQKVVAIGPHPTRLSDETLVVRPGTDAALAMAMGHVLLKEFYLERPVFVGHAKRATDLPFLVRLRERAGGHVPHRFLNAADLGDTSPEAVLKTVMLGRGGRPVVPNGSLGFRDEAGRWNLTLETDPALTLYGKGGGTAEVLLPRFDEAQGVLRRGVPVVRVGDHVVTTVYDLLLAQYGVAREGLPGVWPGGYDDPREPYTPGWQEAITGVAAARAVRVAQEMGATAERTGGRCMIMPGRLAPAHADTAQRAMMALLVLTGCAGVRGGGWAQPRAEAGRLVQAAPWLYLHGDRWRYDAADVGLLSWPLGEGLFNGHSPGAVLTEAVHRGWLPMAPEYARSPLDAVSVPLGHACDDPDDPGNWPRVLTVAGGDAVDECFLHHLLGVGSELSGRGGPSGKLDLFVGSSEYTDLPMPDVRLLAETFSKLAVEHLGVRRDLVGRSLYERDYPETAALLAAGPAPRGPRPEGTPWLTLSGRMHLFVDHDWTHEYGEALPTYRPPAAGQPIKPTLLVRHRGQEVRRGCE
ncbi:molybdopterin-dependent oxidoreductase [Nonomuraea sp. NPDC046570]|uniref:molybdopterin-dependent oxidoreductase n=1 Tax=Nonomuraea sp. NPDC046570 TaxID=3155255 RepID=UPI003410E7F8